MDDDDECLPLEFSKAGYTSVCAYVVNKSENCNGGGYIPWTELKLCEESDTLQIAILVASAAAFIYLFLMLSTTTRFFGTNIATIVDLHRIPQNIAGTTLMAFGNGAPDIFSSIASVISVNRPQAGLAISCLLGAGIFVTTVVIAGIILIKPFTCMRRPVIRDILFYLAALCLLIMTIFYDDQVHLWQPIAFLLLYGFYVITVFGTNAIRQKLHSEKRRERYNSTIRKLSACVPPKAGKNKVTPMNVDRSCQISIGWEKDLRRVPTDLDKTSSTASTVVVTTPPLPTELHEEEEEDSRKTSAGLFPNVLEPSPRTHSFSQRDRKLSLGGSRRSRCTSIVGTTSSHPPNLEDNDNNNKNEFVSEDYIEAGKFFAKEELDAELDSSTGGTPPPESPRFIPDNNIPTAADKKAEEAGIYCKERRAASYLTFDRTTTISNNSLTVVESSSLPFPSTTLPTKHDEAHGDVGPSCWREFIRQLCPLPFDEFDDGAWWERVYLIAKIPCEFLLLLTVPLAASRWCKPLTAIHVLLSPLLFCGAFQVLDLPIANGTLQVWHFSVSLSCVTILLFLLLSNSQKEPRYYKMLSSYVGFVMSIAWIYWSASEIVNIVLMFGYTFGVSSQVLGLTVVAWCNSVGDLIADFSVAKQGFPRMAFTATIGGPLFNLLVGFGLSFTIAKLQGKTVPIQVDAEKLVMLVFITVSLVSTLLMLICQRFRPTKLHSIYLIVLYVAFLVVVLLASQHFF